MRALSYHPLATPSCKTLPRGPTLAGASSTTYASVCQLYNIHQRVPTRLSPSWRTQQNGLCFTNKTKHAPGLGHQDSSAPSPSPSPWSPSPKKRCLTSPSCQTRAAVWVSLDLSLCAQPCPYVRGGVFKLRIPAPCALNQKNAHTHTNTQKTHTQISAPGFGATSPGEECRSRLGTQT